MTDNHYERGGKFGESKASDQSSAGTPRNDKKSMQTSSKSETPPDLVLIGGECQVKGEIRNCRRLEVEGRLEGDFETEVFVVRKSGSTIGTVKAKKAEIHGTFEGNLFVEDLLDVRKTGMVSGDVDYGQLAVVSGGQLAGNLHKGSKLPKELEKTKKVAPAQREERKSAPINRIIYGWISSGKK